MLKNTPPTCIKIHSIFVLSCPLLYKINSSNGVFSAICTLLYYMCFSIKKTAHMNTLLGFGMFSLTDGFDVFFLNLKLAIHKACHLGSAQTESFGHPQVLTPANFSCIHHRQLCESAVPLFPDVSQKWTFTRL